MPKFSFKAKSKSGKEVAGKIEAASRFELARKLREQGNIVISAKEESKKNSLLYLLTIKLNKIKLKEKILFANNLSTMIEAGLSLSRSLSVINRQTENPKMKEIVEALSDEVTKGASFSESLSKFPKVFPPIFIAMVNSGEQSGNLPESLNLIGAQLEKSYELRRKIRGAMIYPAIVITVIVIIGILMMIYLVPTLAETFKSLNAELPTMTRVIIGASEFISENILYIVLFMLVLGYGLFKFLRTARGRKAFSFILLHSPVVKSVTMQANAALTMRTMSSLITSGVGIVESLDITKNVVQNPYYVSILSGAGEEIQKGSNLSAIFQSNEKYYPILVGEMVAVGEETGKLAEMLHKGATFYEKEVDQVTKNLSTIIEPVLMVIVGTAVGFFAVAMIQPMYSLSDVI